LVPQNTLKKHCTFVPLSLKGLFLLQRNFFPLRGRHQTYITKLRYLRRSACYMAPRPAFQRNPQTRTFIKVVNFNEIKQLASLKKISVRFQSSISGINKQHIGSVQCKANFQFFCQTQFVSGLQSTSLKV